MRSSGSRPAGCVPAGRQGVKRPKSCEIGDGEQVDERAKRHPPFCTVRMDAVVALLAGTAAGGIHLGQCRVLLSRHHARRRHPHHRDGGDERLPQGAARQDSRPQRPSPDPAAGIPVDRLGGGRRAHRGDSGRLAGLADQLSLRAGDSVTLVAPRGAVTPMGITPRIKPYKIAAVFEIGMSEYDVAFVFMPLPESQLYFNRSGDVTAIEVYVDKPDQIDRYRRLVTEAANRPIFMVDWRQRNSTFFNALQVERNVMFLILT